MFNVFGDLSIKWIVVVAINVWIYEAIWQFFGSARRLK